MDNAAVKDLTWRAVNRIRLYRIGGWLYFMGLPFLTADWNGNWLLESAKGVAAASFCLAFAYGWNNAHDAGTDSERSKNPLAKVHDDEAIRKARTASLLPLILALTVAPFLGWFRFAIVALVLAVSAVYSAGPKLKAVPLLGSVANLGIFVPLAFLGRPEPSISPESAFLVSALAAALMQNQLLHEMTDFREDQKKGIRTTAIMLGDVPIRLLATLSGAAAAALIFTAGFFMQKGIEVAWECVPLLAVTAVIPVMKLSDPRNAGLARWFQRVSALFSGTAAWVSVELIPNVIAKL